MAKFLDDGGLQYLLGDIKGRLDGKINTSALTTVLNASSTSAQVPAASTVYDFVTNSFAEQTKVKFIIHEGPITDVTTPDPLAIYLQRDDDTDTSWLMFVYADIPTGTVDGEGNPEYASDWIEIGNVEPDLSGYWNNVNLTAMTNAEIDVILAAVFV